MDKKNFINILKLILEFKTNKKYLEFMKHFQLFTNNLKIEEDNSEQFLDLKKENFKKLKRNL